MAYLYDYCTTYARFQPSLTQGAVTISPKPPTVSEAPWTPWMLYGTPTACAVEGGDIVLIWTWTRHRERSAP